MQLWTLLFPSVSYNIIYSGHSYQYYGQVGIYTAATPIIDIATQWIILYQSMPTVSIELLYNIVMAYKGYNIAILCHYYNIVLAYNGYYTFNEPVIDSIVSRELVSGG